MKNLLPGRIELAVFTTLAILLAAVSWQAPKTDLLMAFFAVPLFITAAVMGMRRNPAFAPVRQESAQVSKQPVDQEVEIG